MLTTLLFSEIPYAAKLFGSIVGAFFTIFKGIQLYLKRRERKRLTEERIKKETLEATQKHQMRFDQMCTMVEQMYKELCPGGPDSMKDTLHGLVKNMEWVQNKVSENKDRQEFIASRDEVPVFTASGNNGNLDFVSPAMCTMVKRQESELEGRNWFSCLHPSLKKSVITEWYKSIADKRFFDMKFLFVDKEKKEIPVYVIAKHSFSPMDGTYISSYGIVQSDSN